VKSDFPHTNILLESPSASLTRIVDSILLRTIANGGNEKIKYRPIVF
jgi:hypothetical protein